MKKQFIKDILRLSQTVFSFKELLILFKPDDIKAFQSKLHYYVKKGDLYHIRRGLYAKDANYNRYELATKIYIPSYISFETVLNSAGMIFQYYSQLFVATYQSRELSCDGQTYMFRKIKSTILTNERGLKIENNYSIASTERAFLDTLYLNKGYHFDNLELNWDKVHALLSLYESKTLEETVAKLHKQYETERKDAS